MNHLDYILNQVFHSVNLSMERMMSGKFDKKNGMLYYAKTVMFYGDFLHFFYLDNLVLFY